MIELVNIKKHFDDIKAVDGIYHTINDGMFLGLLGPNGAGKTTTIKMMIGLLDPTEGQILYDGQVLDKDNVAIKKRIGVVSQHVNLDKELTVEENMIFAGKLYHMKKSEIKSKTDELLAFLDLDKVRKRVSKKLSGGMKRKLMIAKALIHDPDYVFLDEPTVGIDVHARREIWRFLKDYHKRGKTIILTSHYIEEAEHLCDRVLLINKGLVFKEDTSENLIKDLGMYKIEHDHGQDFFESLQETHEAASKLKGMYTINKTNLEDVFYHYTKEKVWKS